jgi:hypothetical protein
MSRKRDLNRYLFLELGLWDDELGEDGGESQVSDTWPFELNALPPIQVGGGRVYAFLFEHEGESFFAIDDGALGYEPQAGMTVEDLERQYQGLAWIAAQRPLPLDGPLSFLPWPGSEGAPRKAEHQAHLDALAATLPCGPKGYRVLEGLYLLGTGKYLALVECKGGREAYAVGTDVPARAVGFPEASASRRLAYAVADLAGARRPVRH